MVMFWFQFNYQQNRSHSTKPRCAQHSCGSGHTPAPPCLTFPKLKPFWKYSSMAWPWASQGWGGGLTWFMWADPRYEGTVLLYEKEIETPPHQQGQSRLLEAAPAGETTGARVWGKGNATSQEDASFSHETNLKAEIKKQFKRSSSLFRGKRRSHPRPKQEQFFPQTDFSTAGTSPSEQRCPELSRLKKSLTTKDNSEI